MFRHILEGIIQKSVEPPILYAVVLDGKPATALECDVIWRIRHDEVCLLPVHKCHHVLRAGGIATHQPVPAHCPDVVLLHEHRLL